MSAANPTDQSSDQTPLLQADDQAGYGSELTTAPADGNGPASPPIRKVEVAFGPLACLVAQHCSNTFSNKINGFAIYVFLIEIFKDTLAPASLVGVAFTTCGVFFAGWIGGVVDRTGRLIFVRSVIATQKILQIVNSTLWLILLGPLGKDASLAFHGKASTYPTVITWALFLLSLINACVLHVANIGMDVSVERDWVTAIAQQDSNLLTKLNSTLRMIDLTSKLLAPLFVSVLTASVGYPITAIIIACQNALALITELLWIKVVYGRFPILRIDEDRRKERRDRLEAEDNISVGTQGSATTIAALAQALTWLDTLSMDGIAVSFFKAGRGWDDWFLAAIRALCVLTSTCGTAIMPYLERRLGTLSTGALGIWLEAALIVPPVVIMFITKAAIGEHGSLSDSLWMFGVAYFIAIFMVESPKSSSELKVATCISMMAGSAAVASIGHGDLRVIQAVAAQMSMISYHHTSRLTNDSAEKLGRLLVGHRPGGLSHAIFLSSGSEANESAIKLARQYFVEIGEPDRVHIISRNNSYHGNSIGCVSLTGIPHTSRVSPCYPYRYKADGESDAKYADRLAHELEEEICRIGKGKVAAFFAETVGGAAAGNLTPVPGYFQAIRKVCDKYGVLLVLDEIMCGMGRTGKMHAWEWEGVVPDIQTVGKGLNGGYQALSAVLMQQRIVDGLKSGSGAFANGQTFQCHPAAAAAGIAVLSVFDSDNIVGVCAKRGAELRRSLLESVGEHPNVGEIRGRGLFLSIEFVTDKKTKGTFPKSLPLASLLDNAIFDRGVSVYSGFGKGTADGVVGDHILLSPPLNISSAEIEELVAAVTGGIDDVFKTQEVQEARRW
ncbi:MAG: hypothetical protein TREMPRED_005944 [Tremellales sp. Tagirdzhanova-0007]|nr:MAG: hypothetical protein TREMPRED_005944 [Tremellales sp. Tagirdzhanova-0007]